MTASAGSPPLPDSHHAAQQHNRSRTPRVLVVEDDPPARRSISRSLRRLGYRVLGAQDGVEAMRLYEKHGVDVVVTDIFMPNMDGVDLILNIVLEQRKAPVIVITGAHEKDPCVHSALLFGAREVLSKPFDSERLADSVARALAS